MENELKIDPKLNWKRSASDTKSSDNKHFCNPEFSEEIFSRLTKALVSLVFESDFESIKKSKSTN